MVCQQEEARFVEYAGADGQWELWHARMGDPSENGLRKTLHATDGMPTVHRDIKTLCGGCMKGKQTVAAFPSRSRTKTSRVLELVHTDVMGPMKTLSKGGAKYVLTLVDDHSRYVVAYFMKKKSEVASKLKKIKAFFETQWGERLKCIRSDNGTEFVNGTVAELCRRNGIMHQRSVPYSPQQNGVAERMNRTIMEKARSMLYYKGVSTEWWAEAVNTAVYLINRSSNAHADATPYELGFKIGTKYGLGAVAQGKPTFIIPCAALSIRSSISLRAGDANQKPRVAGLRAKKETTSKKRIAELASTTEQAPPKKRADASSAAIAPTATRVGSTKASASGKKPFTAATATSTAAPEIIASALVSDLSDDEDQEEEIANVLSELNGSADAVKRRTADQVELEGLVIRYIKFKEVEDSKKVERNENCKQKAEEDRVAGEVIREAALRCEKPQKPKKASRNKRSDPLEFLKALTETYEAHRASEARERLEREERMQQRAAELHEKQLQSQQESSQMMAVALQALVKVLGAKDTGSDSSATNPIN
ncbi:unnamed protein product [Phytophthora fragariaefolia]|uniref:Unnamed protein product n=1 Tax=Phytophthora fragariaefolia TaxID=1490495 RepID=A0A9W6X4B1_9STRA|nr:unnamed protein product [Phytophthora fragariaefolia]